MNATAMLTKLFLAFTLIPVAEIYLLMTVGSAIGVMTTLAIVILTGLLGASMARMQGARTMMEVRESIARGIMPAEELLDAVIIFVAGVLLLTPGFLTDLMGLFLLFPDTRRIFKRYARREFDIWISRHRYPGRPFGD